MKDWAQKINRVYVDKAARDSKLAQRLPLFFSPDQIHWVSESPFKEKAGELAADEYTASKRHLWITPFKGQFFKRCPGSRPGLTCCNYFVLNLGLQCNMDCSYCYLQSFINTPIMTIYSNIDTALAELRKLGEELGEQAMRVGTGEVIDSLSLDELTLYSHDLIAFFRDFPKWQLEFKTKSDRVDQFIDVAHVGNVIVSWSINPQTVVEREEKGTASLEERLRAARRCRTKGFPVAFHIDPMIWHPTWKQSYRDLVANVTTLFSPEEVPYLSVGALRFQPEQRAIMRERFGATSWVTQAEMFPSKDGKLRYDQDLRTEMFEFLLREFKNSDPRWRIFLCMETPETWLKTGRAVPTLASDLKPLFDRRPLRAFENCQ